MAETFQNVSAERDKAKRDLAQLRDRHERALGELRSNDYATYWEQIDGAIAILEGTDQ